MEILTSILVTGAVLAVWDVILPRRTRAPAPKKEPESTAEQQDPTGLLAEDKSVEGLRSDECKDDPVKEAGRGLALSAGAGALWVGAMLYPPIAPLSLPPLVMAVSPLLRTAYKDAKKSDGKLAVALIDGLWIGGAIVTGNVLACSFACVLLYSSQKLFASTEAQSREALSGLMGEQPRTVWVEREGVEVEISLEDLSAGETVVIEAGSVVPIDGTVLSGVAGIDERVLTGESRIAEKCEGDLVLAQTLVVEGCVRVRVEQTGEDCIASQLVAILNDSEDFTQSIRARGHQIVERGAVPTLVGSVIALSMVGPTAAVAALFAGFGYQMRHAAPLCVLGILGKAADKGVFVKDGRALEQLSQVDTIIFDKTGTLTLEVPLLHTIHTPGTYSEEHLLAIAAGVERRQSHPIAAAICNASKERGLTAQNVDSIRVETGRGLVAQIGGACILIGSPGLMDRNGVVMPPQVVRTEEACLARGNTPVYIAVNSQVVGIFEFKTHIRPGTREVIRALQRRNLRVHILSGDREEPTRALADMLKVDGYTAQVLPQAKGQVVEELQAQGHTVCFVGDGINDALALKRANVSISLSGATAVATDTASVVLMDGTLQRIETLIELSEDLDDNLRTGTVLTVIPGIICLGGVLFFHFGIGTAISLYFSTLLLSLGNAMRPRLGRSTK